MVLSVDPRLTAPCQVQPCSLEHVLCSYQLAQPIARSALSDSAAGAWRRQMGGASRRFNGRRFAPAKGGSFQSPRNMRLLALGAPRACKLLGFELTGEPINSKGFVAGVPGKGCPRALSQKGPEDAIWAHF